MGMAAPGRPKPEELIDGLAHAELLGLFLADALADGIAVIVAAAAESERPAGQRHHVFPQAVGRPGLRQLFAHFARRRRILAVAPGGRPGPRCRSGWPQSCTMPLARRKRAPWEG